MRVWVFLGILIWCNGSVLASGYRGTDSIPAILINFLLFFTAEEVWVGGGWKVSKGGGRGGFWFFYSY